MNPTVYSVNQLNSQIKNTLEATNQFKNIAVKGEIINYHNSGHIYFTLKDNDNQASIRCTFWRFNNQKNNIELRDHMKIIIHGNISVYTTKGEYSINVIHVEEIGLGQMLLQVERLKEKYYKLGYFDESLKKRLIKYPDRIGIVTAKGAAGLQDILKTVHHYYPSCQIFLFPCLVQGTKSPASIAKAIKTANHFSNTKTPLDTLIVGRGGGSIEDLWVYNDELVIEAIHNSKLCIVSGIGHEIDNFISDQVADVTARTPTYAAKMVVPNKENMLMKFDQTILNLQKNIANDLVLFNTQLHGYKKNVFFKNSNWIFKNITHKIMLSKNKMNMIMKNTFARVKDTTHAHNSNFKQYLQYRYNNDIKQTKIDCAHLKDQIQNHWSQILQNNKVFYQNEKIAIVDLFKKTIKTTNHIKFTLKIIRQKLHDIVLKNQKWNKQTMKLWQQTLENYHTKFDILRQGYTLTTINGVKITDLTQIPASASLKTIYSKGILYSKLEKQIRSNQIPTN